jgi:hypothetical protein
MSLSQNQTLMYSPIMSCIKPLFQNFPEKHNLPPAHLLNTNFNAINHNQKRLKFVPQDESLLQPELGYEERIFEHGLIATRENNWHDFFNAMVWTSFPRIKSSLNAIHFLEQQQQVSSVRSRRRDWLTLFDENGVIVFADKTIKEQIRNHQWQELFIKQESLWRRGDIQIATFGHALYEKYLKPYIGMTAHALVVDKDMTDVDKHLSHQIMSGELLINKSDLLPLPLLGIPGWHPHQDLEFYSNKTYFR